MGRVITLLLALLLLVGCSDVELVGRSDREWEKANQHSKPKFSEGDIVAYVSSPDKAVGHVYSVKGDYCARKWTVWVRMLSNNEVTECKPVELVRIKASPRSRSRR